MGFLRRQVITAALTANAIRPLPGFRVGVPSFFAGWLTSELAPHLLALTAADAATHTPNRRRDPAGLVLAGASLTGLAFLIKQARDVQERAEECLAEGLGVDYLDQLETKPTPADLATPWRRLVNPFRMRESRVRVGRTSPTTTTADAGCSTSTSLPKPRSRAPRCCSRCTAAPG